MNKENEVEPLLESFENLLKESGIHDALGFLSHRTPHRYTGIYQFDGDTLRNLAMYDCYDPTVENGDDAPMASTYCSLVQTRAQLEIMDAAHDDRVKGIIITPVVSYCGVLIRDAAGKPFGTLCHFDMKRCQEASLDIPLLEQAARLLFKHLKKGTGTEGYH